MSSSSLLQLFLLCLLRFTKIAFEMGSKWSHCYCFAESYFLDLYKISSRILMYFPSSRFSMRFVSVDVVHPYCRTDTATASKKSHFILSERVNFDMINNLSIAVHNLPKRMLTSISVDEILLPIYLNLFTNLRRFTTSSGDGFFLFV